MIRKGIDYSYCWLQLELTDYCNLNCSMCLSGNSRKLLNIDTPHRIWADNLKHQVSFDFKTSKDFDQVYLVGDFNYWGILEDSYNLSKPTVKNIEMFKTSSGWSQEFEIATGKYRFAYLTCKNDKYEWHTSTEHPLAKDPVSDLPVSYIEIGKPKMLRRGFMSLDLIRKILDELVEKRITLNEVTPFWFGESMVHPDFIEILELLSYYNRKFTIFKRLGLHTNALLMNSSVTNQLIKVAGDFPGGLKISFSVDACTSQVYEKIRSAGTFNECIRNIKYFLQKSGNNPDILSAIQFIVQQDNFDESVEFYNYWRTFLRNNRLNYCFSDSFEYSNFENGQTVIFFRPLDNTSESRESGDMLFKKAVKKIHDMEGKIELESKTNNSVFDDSDKVCSSPWRSIFVQWNGEVTVCCADTFSNLSIGNFETDNFDTIWHDGTKIKKLRADHLDHTFDTEFLRCRFCPQWEIDPLSQAEKKLYLEYLRNNTNG